MRNALLCFSVMASISIGASVASAGESGHYLGESVEVEWNGKFWPAHVMATVGEKFAVHFDGYADEWDDIVSAQRIAPRAAPSFFVERQGALVPVRIVNRANDGHMLVRHDAGEEAVDGARVHRQSPTGRLYVERQGAYYAATVMGLAGGAGGDRALTRVHFDGTSNDHDESVSASRMKQLAPF